MKNYASFYENLIRPFRARPSMTQLLIGINGLITKLMPLVYLLLLLYLFESSQSIAKVLPYVLIPALSFILLSLVRLLYNQPRPYEDWDLQPLITKNSKGRSMPSRHVFSAALISVCVLRIHLLLGIVLLILSALLAFCRVLGGVHYPKDVLVGYGLGLIAGALLFLV